MDPGPWGLQRPLAPGSQGRAQRHHSVLVTPPPPEAPPRPWVRPHRVAGMRGRAYSASAARQGPEGGDGACPSCHPLQQVPGGQLRPLSLSPLDSSLGPARAAVYKHSLTGNLREKCLGFAHVPAWVWARNPGQELCRTPHSPPATFPTATVPRHSGPRRVLVHFCFWSRLPLSHYLIVEGSQLFCLQWSPFFPLGNPEQDRKSTRLNSSH